MGSSFEDLYESRQGPYAKDEDDERFLKRLNEDLQPLELELYRDAGIDHPFVFVLGLPRSGTTLTSQLLAYCLDAGYVNNVAARFWLAPVHGIRLARLIAGEKGETSFRSDYARTDGLLDIHEFGYFWRHWLRKHTFDDVVHARERESEIDWDGLRRTLANVQLELGKPFVAKNVLAAYHLDRVGEALEQVVWVYVERDHLDACVSILDARRRYYADPRTWWSYVPPEYPLLEHLDEWGQIAGQVHYLARFYERELARTSTGAVVRIRYEELCADPSAVLDAVRATTADAYGYALGVRDEPPASFPVRRYDDRTGDRERFDALLGGLREEA
jgi:hypothetical protein